MKIAVIGGGASGLVTAHYLDRKHDVTVFEKQPILGGNVRTLRKNVQSGVDKIPEGVCIDNGVIEFDRSNFVEFHNLMDELGVEMEPVSLTTGYFGANGKHILSLYRIFHAEPDPVVRARELFRLRTCVLDFGWFMTRTAFAGPDAFKGYPVSRYLGERPYQRWLKMLLMYAYSIPYERIDEMPAELGIPVLRRCSLFTKWTRIKGGVYTYMERILERFQGTIVTDASISSVSRADGGVQITIQGQDPITFDRVVFATPPDQVLKMLADPSEQEQRRFRAWRENVAHTIIHTDDSLYDGYQIESRSAFDVFAKGTRDAGYNGYLNPLVGQPDDAGTRYHLAFNLDDRISPDRVLHVQEHRTPLYTVDAFEFRDEIIETNGENHTYHAGAYLDDGLHEGAVRSALAVARLLDRN